MAAAARAVEATAAAIAKVVIDKTSIIKSAGFSHYQEKPALFILLRNQEAKILFLLCRFLLG